MIVDVDLDLIIDLHYHGSVRTLADRRKYLYTLLRNNLNERISSEIKPVVRNNIKTGTLK